jgi:hypothetical protein
MPKLLKPGQPYVGRRDDAVVLNVTIDHAAATLLRKYCPEGRKGLGHFITRLLYQHDARQQEAQRLHERGIHSATTKDGKKVPANKGNVSKWLKQAEEQGML